MMASHNSKRLLIREYNCNSSADQFEMLRPEEDFELSYDTQFNFIGPVPGHSEPHAFIRSETFRFISNDTHPLPTKRYYNVKITDKFCPQPLRFTESLSVFELAQQNLTSVMVKRLWGAGVNRFNKYFGNFGDEFLLNDVESEVILLNYHAITIDVVRSQSRMSRTGDKRTREEDRKSVV